MMSISTIESELNKMTDAERQSVVDIATRLLFRESKDSRKKLERKRARLRESAELMYEHYLNDKELTIWTALDGEELRDA